MTHFTTDELVTATALLVSGIITPEADASPVSTRNHNQHIFQADSAEESGPSLVSRLGLIPEQQHRIRLAYEQRREKINTLSEEIERQSEELYRVPFSRPAGRSNQRDAKCGVQTNTFVVRKRACSTRPTNSTARSRRAARLMQRATHP